MVHFILHHRNPYFYLNCPIFIYATLFPMLLSISNACFIFEIMFFVLSILVGSRAQAQFLLKKHELFRIYILEVNPFDWTAMSFPIT